MGRVKALGLPKTGRLRTQADFDRVHATGLKFHGRYLLARVDLTGTESKLGLRVSKRHGTAVQRNRIKRLLREGFRRSCGGWRPPAAVVLIPKSTPWPDLKLRELQDDFERLGRQIERWAGPAKA